MSTFGQLVDDVLLHLRSYVRDQEQATFLTQTIDATDLVLHVDDPTAISRGRVEIDDELIYLSRVDRDAGTAAVPPFGRGHDSTAAASHLEGAKVTNAPLFPRGVVKRIINSTIRSVGASLYGVKEEVLTPHDSLIYELPADARDVLSVKMVDTVSPTRDFEYLNNWHIDVNAPSSVSTTGKALYLYVPVPSMIDIVVTYSCDPVELVDADDEFSTVTTLPATSEDVVVLLAASRLLATADAYATQTRSIEANTLDSKIQPGNAVAQSKYLLALGQQRLVEERTRLLNKTANRSHYRR